MMSHIICRKYKFKPDGSDKIHEHDHYTGLWRGTSCQKCNTKYWFLREVSLFAHDLSKYDSHLFIKELASRKCDRNMEVIPSNDETYISFTKPVKFDVPQVKRKDGKPSKQKYLRLVFKDSSRFLAGSLDSQVKNLMENDFHFLNKFLSGKKYPQDKINLLKRKGVFPYSYIEDFTKYKEVQLTAK